MAQRAVKWTRTADVQYVGILEYWAKRNNSPSYPKKLIKAVSERTKQLAESPFLYKRTDFSDTRVTSINNFSMFYKVTDEAIIITAFWDNRQDPNTLLKILQAEK